MTLYSGHYALEQARRNASPAITKAAEAAKLGASYFLVHACHALHVIRTGDGPREMPLWRSVQRCRRRTFLCLRSS